MKSHSDSKKSIPNKIGTNSQPFFKKQEGQGSFFKGADENTSAPAPFFNAAPVQRKENKNLSEEVQMKMESTFGEDFSDVAIHKNSQQAKDLNALAYTQGDNIHFAPGQFNQNSRQGQALIGHEFAHVQQQRQGRVAPTIQAKGLNINDDHVLEKEADAMGEKAAGSVQMKSNALDMRTSLRNSSSIIQMAPVPTHYGEFRDKKLVPVSDYGAEIELEFHPNTKVDAKKIGIVQTVKGYMGGHATDFSPTRMNRTTADGLYIDRIDERNNPIYGGQSLDANKGKLGDTNNSGGNYHLGWKYKDAAGADQTKEAYLYDKPTQGGGNKKNSGQVFETTALAIEGAQEGTYYGSVKWGWEVDGANKFSLLPLSLISLGLPSKEFIAGAEKWNDSASLGTVNTIRNPTNVYDAAYSVAFTVPQNTKVTGTETRTYLHDNLSYNQITVVADGRTGRIKTSDLKDQGDGAANVDLPTGVYLVQPATTMQEIGAANRINLPVNTRVVLKAWQPYMGNQVEVEIGDGPDVGKRGMLNNDYLFHELNHHHPLGAGYVAPGGGGGDTMIG